MKMSVVVTVKNDREGEKKLRDALSRQTRQPDEVIIIRAEEHGNCSRAEGRNIGIREAKNDGIAVTDVGCTPHKDWLERLEEGFQMDKKDEKEGSEKYIIRDATASRIIQKSQEQEITRQGIVVAGFYRTVTKTALQKAIAPYLAILPHQWNQQYLPASRSIAFTKPAWELVGGYPEEARSGAEDLVFAARLAKHPDINLIYAPDALVDWEPPRTPRAFFSDIVKHTRGNREVRYWPHLVRNYSVLFRWLAFLLIPWLIPFYALWPIVKHRRNVGWKAIPLLPFVQVVADAAVIYALLR